MRKYKNLIPLLAFAISIFLSAFTVGQSSKANTITSYFANESQASGSLTVDLSTVPSSYTNVTSAVESMGEVAYKGVHCPTSGIICFVVGISMNDGPFVVIELFQGSWVVFV